MSHSSRIDAKHREFCELVAEAAFTNPFGQQRLDLDQRIIKRGENVSGAERIRMLTGIVKDRVAQMEKDGKAHLRHYSGSDRFTMQTVFLFEVFHLFFEQFDRLITEQIKEGASPARVPFANDALAHLAGRGFSENDSIRFFAILYQMRRAHFFIAQGLIGHSPCMQEFRRHLWNNVFTHDVRWYERFLWNRMEDFSTLLLGETGTGKGTAAAAIGRSGFIPFDSRKGCFSESFTHSFVSLNLSQFPETLIESELFGHKKGAFTGAVEAHEGIFARCSACGAIFLDEIGDVSTPIQIKLLQVLQDRTFSPVGGHQRIRFHGRVIAATNKPLDVLRGQGLFRDDFFYRLCSDTITVPSLRQRLVEDADELPQLLEHVITRIIGEESKELVVMVREVIERDLGKDYPWPGNVRELEQAVRRILITRQYPGETQESTGTHLPEQLYREMQAGSLNADELLSGYCRVLYQRFRNYEEVARRTQLDRRTVKKYLERNSFTKSTPSDT